MNEYEFLKMEPEGAQPAKQDGTTAKLPNFKTAQELWTVIIKCPYDRLTNPQAWQSLTAQISPLVALTGDQAADTQELVNQILKLPFPKGELGVCDSTEYDTYCRFIIDGFHRVIRAQEASHSDLPADAPQLATIARTGNMLQVSGHSRIQKANENIATERRSQIKAEIERLDTTEACKEELKKHFGEDRGWKRIKKFNLDREIARIFQDRLGQTNSFNKS